MVQPEVEGDVTHSLLVTSFQYTKYVRTTYTKCESRHVMACHSHECDVTNLFYCPQATTFALPTSSHIVSPCNDEGPPTSAAAACLRRPAVGIAVLASFSAAAAAAARARFGPASRACVGRRSRPSTRTWTWKRRKGQRHPVTVEAAGSSRRPTPSLEGPVFVCGRY